MKSGFITIIGRPNAGKSTLINRFVGEKIAIVSWRPQTTRNKILGVANGDGYQAIFTDTPGLHKAQNVLGDFMMKSVRAALEELDILLYVCDITRGVSSEDIQYITDMSQRLKVVVAVNKTDCVAPETLAEGLTKLIGTPAVEVVPISAKRGDNTDKLLELLVNLLPEQEALMPDDVLTDKGYRFMCSELIREKALKNLSKEIPYGIGVAITKFEQRDDGLYEISADIVCEKQSHKGIIIGKQGAMLKKISTEARLDMEEMLESQVYLSLYVKVDEDWRNKLNLLIELGYDKKNV